MITVTTVQYIGQRAYVEFQHEGRLYGFSRGMSRDDIPEDLALKFQEPGFPQWEVTSASGTSEALLAVVEQDDSSNVDAGFNPEWTRGEMIKWFSAQGESVPRTSTKASLTARAAALLNPPAVVEDNTEEPEATVEEADADDSGEGDE